MSDPARTRREVDRIIARAVLRGAAQRRRDDPDDEEDAQESHSHFDADENARLLFLHAGGSDRKIHLRKCERGRSVG